MVARQRRGQWTELKDGAGEWLGRGYNEATHLVRVIADRFPGLRKLAEVQGLSAPVVRGVWRTVAKAWLGPIEVSREADPSIVMAEVLSRRSSLEPGQLEAFEKLQAKGKLHLFAATSRRLGRIGSMIVQEGGTRKSRWAWVFSIQVVAGFRSLGVGRKLLTSLEAFAREKSIARLGARVARDNTRSLGLFRAAGFTLTDKPVAARPPIVSDDAWFLERTV